MQARGAGRQARRRKR